MTRTAPPRSARRLGLGDAGLLAALTVALGGLGGLGGWVVWAKGHYDHDVERRWALPREAKALAEEEISLTPRTAGELAEDEVKAAVARYEAAVEAARVSLEYRRVEGDLSAADAAAELTRVTGIARARFDEEATAANEKAERLHRDLERRTADRRLQLRRDALALVAEWDALFARHPEWPPHRLTAEE